jgi:hypothetical protein
MRSERTIRDLEVDPARQIGGDEEEARNSISCGSFCCFLALFLHFCYISSLTN